MVSTVRSIVARRKQGVMIISCHVSGQASWPYVTRPPLCAPHALGILTPVERLGGSLASKPSSFLSILLRSLHVFYWYSQLQRWSAFAYVDNAQQRSRRMLSLANVDKLSLMSYACIHCIRGMLPTWWYVAFRISRIIANIDSIYLRSDLWLRASLIYE